MEPPLGADVGPISPPPFPAPIVGGDAGVFIPRNGLRKLPTILDMPTPPASDEARRGKLNDTQTSTAQTSSSRYSDPNVTVGVINPVTMAISICATKENSITRNA